MGGRTSLALWCIVASACSGSDEIPEKLTKITHIDLRGQFRFVAQGETFYLQTTRADANGFSVIKEETDYRKFFSDDSKVVVSTESYWSLQLAGAAESLFVFADGDVDMYAGGARWPAQPQIELFRCNQPGDNSLYGTAERPVIYLDNFNCNLGCESLSMYRDAAIFVGDSKTHTFHMACAPDFGKPREKVPIGKYFVIEGPDFVRVSQINSANEMETVVQRDKPEGITEVFGIFDEDLSLLASTGIGSTLEIVEFNVFDGGIHPSRFDLPTGFTVQRVFRPAPDKTFAYGWKADARTNTLKRNPREAEWEMDFPVVNEGQSEFEIAVSTKAVVQLQLEYLDGGDNDIDVWIQRFPY